MTAGRLTIAVALSAVAMGAAVGKATAAAVTRVDPCALLTPAQVTAVAGLSAKCTRAPASAALGAKLYTANWPGTTATGPMLQVTLAVYTDPGALRLATRNLGQGLPGPAHRISGIGSTAYTGRGGDAAGVHILVGRSIVYVVLAAHGAGGAPPAAMVEGLSKTIARRLG